MHRMLLEPTANDTTPDAAEASRTGRQDSPEDTGPGKPPSGVSGQTVDSPVLSDHCNTGTAPAGSHMEGEAAGQHTVKTSDLVVGRRLQFPLYDTQGMLLLASGSIITPRLKETLIVRNLNEVHVSPLEAEHLTCPIPSADELASELDQFCLSHALAQQVDQIVDSQSLFVRNDGPALRQQILHHGRRPIDPETRQQLARQNTACLQALDGMMQQAARGNSQRIENVQQIASLTLSNMSRDFDALLSMASATNSDGELSQHCLKMSLLGMAMAVEMGFDAENTRIVGLCGLLHDWGMLRVPDALRKSPRRLSPSEFVSIQRHPIYSLEMLQQLQGTGTTIPLVCYQIHERCNGSGYPRHREGRGIHPFAQILNVADSYVALTSPRRYRPPLMPHAALECLLDQSAEGLVDPKVVQALLNTLSLYPLGSLVELSDGSIAQSLRRNGLKCAHPIIRIICRPTGEKVPLDDPGCILDLSESEQKIIRPLPFPGRNESALTTEIFENLRYEPY